LCPNFFTCSGLGHSADGLGWIVSHKMDPMTTLLHRFKHVCVQLPAYADYTALPAFPQHVSAAERRQCNNRSIYLARLANSSKPAADRRTGRQRDRRTLYTYKNPVPCTMRVVPKTLQEKRYKTSKCEKIKTLKSVIKRLSHVKCHCRMSCFADWSKRRHVTLSTIICSKYH